MKFPILLSVPHAGWKIPPEVQDICILSEKDIIEDGDVGAAEIYYPLEEKVKAFLTTEIGRAIVDLNRAENDFWKDGVIKTHTCWDVPVYNSFPSEAVIEALLEKYYRPYHRQLTGGAQEMLLGIDCHTMAAKGPPVGPDPGKVRPRLCLSNADGTCPQRWMEIFRDSFARIFDGEVSINFPFKGGHITRSHACELPWMQLEISRAPFLSNPEKSRLVLESLHEAIPLLE